MNRGVVGQRGRQLSPTARGSLYYFGLSGASATFLPFVNVFYADRGLSGREIGLLGRPIRACSTQGVRAWPPKAKPNEK